jgi:hypothetical protein
MIDLLTAIKTALDADATLAAYNEIVDIRKWRADSLPDFETYGIVVSPSAQTVEDDAIRSKRDRLVVRLYVLAYDFGANALNGESAGAVGILKMVADVIACLEGNDLAGYVELTGEEINASIALNEVPAPGRDRFYHEVTLELTYYKPARAW